MKVTPGSTDVTTYFVLRLAADGTEATGLTITNFDLQYVRSGASPVAKVDATALAATNSAHGDNQAIEIDATDQPGLYRVDWPDAAFAAGVREVVLTVKCATCFTEHLRVELEPLQTGDNFARLGAPAGASVSADIAAVKSDTAAILVDTGTTLDGKIDTIDGIVDAILVDTAEIGAAGAGLTNINLPDQTMNITGDITGNLSGSVGSVTGNVGGNVTGTIGGLTAAALKDFFDTDSTTDYASAVAGSVVKEIADNAGGSALTAEAIADAVWDEDTTGHTTSGTFGEQLKTDVDAILADTNELQTDWANGGRLDNILDARASQASVDIIDDFVDTEVAAILAAVDTEVAAIKAKTDQLVFTNANQVDATVIQIANNAVSAASLAADAGNELADALLDRNIATGTDSGNNTDVRTVRQALRLLRNKVSIAAGTATITKEDDSTTSWTAAVTRTAGDPISAVDPGGP